MRRETATSQGLPGSVTGPAPVFQPIDTDFRLVTEMGENVPIILSTAFAGAEGWKGLAQGPWGARCTAGKVPGNFAASSK